MESLTNFQEDVLADVLRSIHLQSTLYCRAKMGAPWGFRVSRRQVASFHLVTGGTCWLTVDGVDAPCLSDYPSETRTPFMPFRLPDAQRRMQSVWESGSRNTDPVLLSEGDLVILPHGHSHTMTDHPGSPVTRLEDLKPRQPVGNDGIFYSMGSGAVTTLVCGGLQLEDYTINPLYSILPAYIHIRGQSGQPGSWLQSIVKLVRFEASANRLEAETVITRLSEILFIKAVRTYITTTNNGNDGWLGALKDPQIGQALALIQSQPDEPWTVESLASSVALSRSAFSAKFKQLVGEPPMQYITRVRLTKAAALLRTHPATLVQVAASIGYDSEVAFSKAFKRYFGIAPGAYRQGTRSPLVNGTLGS